MTTTQTAVRTEAATRRRAVVAATIGNFVEWYDFSVYAFFATVIGTLFFGHYGDKVGRKNTLAAVVLLMAGATVLIGILPTYAQTRSTADGSG